MNGFASRRFFEIGRWTLVAYLVTKGMIVLAVPVPMLIACTVARYYDLESVRRGAAWPGARARCAVVRRRCRIR